MSKTARVTNKRFASLPETLHVWKHPRMILHLADAAGDGLGAVLLSIHAAIEAKTYTRVTCSEKIFHLKDMTWTGFCLPIITYSRIIIWEKRLTCDL